MAEPQTPPTAADYRIQDPVAFSRNMVKVAAQSQRLVTDFMKAQAKSGKPNGGGSADPLNLGQTFVDFLGHAMRNPGHFVEANFRLWQDYLNLWHHTARRMLGEDVAPSSSRHGRQAL
jgi:polyhydroxyalkanoate synthase